MLDELDTFFVTEEVADTEALWAILSALRGPDDDDCRLKDHTTIPIRRAAFPRLTANSFHEVEGRNERKVIRCRTSAIFRTSDGSRPTFKLPPAGMDCAPSGHFIQHADMAWQAIHDPA
jgi:hypothetical protein